MAFLILILGMVVSGLILFHWLSTANPQVLSRMLAALLPVALIAGVIALGLIAWPLAAAMLPVILALLPRMLRSIPIILGVAQHAAAWRNANQRARAARGPAPGTTSRVTTATVTAVLDHESGEMQGRVIDGPLAGRDFETLGRDDWLDLVAACREVDPETVPIIEAYLDRTVGAEWRAADAERARQGNSPESSANMAEEEAYHILGLEPGADPQAIRDAHRRLMKACHPDQGGSVHLAAQINAAKERLLGK